VQSANLVGATTVPRNVPRGCGTIATRPPLKDQTPSIGSLAAAEAAPAASPRTTAAIAAPRENRCRSLRIDPITRGRGRFFRTPPAERGGCVEVGEEDEDGVGDNQLEAHPPPRRLERERVRHVRREKEIELGPDLAVRHPGAGKDGWRDGASVGVQPPCVVARRRAGDRRNVPAEPGFDAQAGEPPEPDPNPPQDKTFPFGLSVLLTTALQGGAVITNPYSELSCSSEYGCANQEKT